MDSHIEHGIFHSYLSVPEGTTVSVLHLMFYYSFFCSHHQQTREGSRWSIDRAQNVETPRGQWNLMISDNSDFIFNLGSVETHPAELFGCYKPGFVGDEISIPMESTIGLGNLQFISSQWYTLVWGNHHHWSTSFFRFQGSPSLLVSTPGLAPRAVAFPGRAGRVLRVAERRASPCRGAGVRC